MTGHLFVVHGDLTKLACDALLVPTDAAMDVTKHWHKLFAPERLRVQGRFGRMIDIDPPEGWGRELRGFKLPEQSLGRTVWLVETGGSGGVDWVVDGVADAIGRIAVEGIKPPKNRQRPLVGLSLPGVGAGGLYRQRGALIDALLPRLVNLTIEHGLDLALVLFDERDFSAVQRARPAPPSTSAGLDAEAERLGGLAADGQLVLFLGSGISLPVGLPTWKALLDELAGVVNRPPEKLRELPLLDAAQVIARLFGDGFGPWMAQRFTLKTHALGHALVASLDVASAVTTNYDNGYELAMRRRVRVLPRERAQPGVPWLLKMHGDVADPASIVLTREHYLDYADTRTPLAGMVQALLMTRHLMFVGFSMVDDNFARLAHQVQRVLTPSASADSRLGTVLRL